jgi:hypothetical protein
VGGIKEVKKKHLKDVVIALSITCLLCSCSAPIIPAVEGKTYPNVPIDWGWRVAASCRKGSYTGKRIKDMGAYELKTEPPRPDPEGRGKVHTLYLKDTGETDDRSTEIYGFTYTVHTNEDGIITKCSVARQYLGWFYGRY